MLLGVGTFFESILLDRQLLLFVLASVCLTAALFSLRREGLQAARTLLVLGGVLLTLGYAVMIPAVASFELPVVPQVNFAHLTLNLAWLSLGGGFFLTTLRPGKN